MNPMDRGGWRATVHGVRKSQDSTEQLALSLLTGSEMTYILCEQLSVVFQRKYCPLWNCATWNL